MAKLTFYGPTGSNDDNTNHFIKITPGLYIVEENNNLYASTTRPTSIPVILIEHTYSLCHSERQ